jgi:hypothetical protein
MVNVGFPARPGYGFERVDAPEAPYCCGKSPSIEYLHRIQSIEFSAIFRLFNLNANTCDLSTTVNQVQIAKSIAAARDVSQRLRIAQRDRKRRRRDVFSASHGILARAGAGAVAQGEDT